MSDASIEDTTYDSQTIRSFIGMDLNVESVAEAITLLKFFDLLGAKNIIYQIFDTTHTHFAEKSSLMRERTIFDVTQITAPLSTKNSKRRFFSLKISY